MSVKTALISVSDKKGVLEFAQGLSKLGWRILSTGGTLKHLKDNGVPAVQVSDHTGSPEILDGRVKTLHPRIHGGILAMRSNAAHVQQLGEQKIDTIDIVAVEIEPPRSNPRDSVLVPTATPTSHASSRSWSFSASPIPMVL